DLDAGLRERTRDAAEELELTANGALLAGNPLELADRVHDALWRRAIGHAVGAGELVPHDTHRAHPSIVHLPLDPPARALERKSRGPALNARGAGRQENRWRHPSVGNLYRNTPSRSRKVAHSKGGEKPHGADGLGRALFRNARNPVREHFGVRSRDSAPRTPIGQTDRRSSLVS